MHLEINLKADLYLREILKKEDLTHMEFSVLCIDFHRITMSYLVHLFGKHKVQDTFRDLMGALEKEQSVDKAMSIACFLEIFFKIIQKLDENND